MLQHGRIDALCEKSARTKVFGRKRFRLDGKERDRVKGGWNPDYLATYDQGLQSPLPEARAETGVFVYANWNETLRRVGTLRQRWQFGDTASAIQWAESLPAGAKAAVCIRRLDCLIDLSDSRPKKEKESRGRVTKPVFVPDYSGADFA